MHCFGPAPWNESAYITYMHAYIHTYMHTYIHTLHCLDLWSWHPSEFFFLWSHHLEDAHRHVYRTHYAQTHPHNMQLNNYINMQGGTASFFLQGKQNLRQTQTWNKLETNAATHMYVCMLICKLVGRTSIHTYIIQPTMLALRDPDTIHILQPKPCNL